MPAISASGTDHTQALDGREVSVIANQPGTHYQCGSSDPQVIFVQRQASSLLCPFEFGIAVPCIYRNAPTGYDGKQLCRFRRQFRASTSGGQSLNAEKNLAPRDDANTHIVIRPCRGRPRGHPGL